MPSGDFTLIEENYINNLNLRFGIQDRDLDWKFTTNSFPQGEFSIFIVPLFGSNQIIHSWYGIPCQIPCLIIEKIRILEGNFENALKLKWKFYSQNKIKVSKRIPSNYLAHLISRQLKHHAATPKLA